MKAKNRYGHWVVSMSWRRPLIEEKFSMCCGIEAKKVEITCECEISYGQICQKGWPIAFMD